MDRQRDVQTDRHPGRGASGSTAGMLGAVLALLLMVAFSSLAQIPRTLSYQGVLTDSLGTPKPDGTYTFTFRLYQAASGGAAVWTEQKTLQVRRGLFQTVLGDQVVLGSSLTFDRPYWLSIQVASEPELSPRIPLTSVGYSLHAGKADTARTADTARYAMSAPLQAAVDSARIASRFVLPFAGTTSETGSAFSITQSGTGGGGIRVLLTNASNGSRGLEVVQSGVGPGVFSTSTGGNALWGITSSISAAGVIGDNTFGEAVVGRNRGGNGVGSVVGRNDSSGYGVRGFNTKTGIGVLGQAGISGGTGVGGRFENVNAASTSDALQAVTNGTGRAGLFTTGAGAATFTAATAQLQNFRTTGEALWARVNSASNASPVMKMHIHPSSSASFIDGYTWDGSAAAVRKFHISTAGSFVSGSDFAEAFTAAGNVASYEPGDVVVLSRSGGYAVEKTGTPYDTRVAGVYSTRPGVLGADKDGVTRLDDTDIPVAIIGIVPTKVSDENGTIRPGDLLTTSSTPGYAMKASPVDINGVRLYPAGVIIGKAMEQLAGRRGLIKVLITLR